MLWTLDFVSGNLTDLCQAMHWVYVCERTLKGLGIAHKEQTTDANKDSKREGTNHNTA